MKKDKSELIAVIEKTIDVLENNKVEYDWYSPSSCNCGILAQQACNITKHELSTKLYSNPLFNGSWNRKVLNCPVTGERMSDVISKLYSLGLTRKDLSNLEHLRDPMIASRARLSGGIFEFPKNDLINYLQAWKDLLIEESQPEAKTEYRLVYSDQKVKDLTKEELIMN